MNSQCQSDQCKVHIEDVVSNSIILVRVFLGAICGNRVYANIE